MGHAMHGMHDMDLISQIKSRLVGQELREVQQFEHQWQFHFANRMNLSIECPWRILKDGQIAFGDQDHAQQFGLPAPIDGLEQTNLLLLNRFVQKIEVRDDTADLTLSFGDRLFLEILNLSSGYEGWQLSDDAEFIVVAQGGGSLAVPTVYRGWIH